MTSVARLFHSMRVAVAVDQLRVTWFRLAYTSYLSPTVQVRRRTGSRT